MNSSNDKFHDLRELIEKSLDGSITPEELAGLDDCIAHNPEQRQYYCEYIHMTIGLMRLCDYVPLTGVQDYDKLYFESLWNALILEEKAAPTVITEEPIKITETNQPRKKDKKTNKVLPVLAGACLSLLLFIVTLAHFYQMLIPREVATLSTSLNAAFTEHKTLAAGTRLINRKESLLLQSGLIEIVFDGGAKVLLEAPAKFRLKSADRMVLNTGQLFAFVPDYAQGFTVETPNSHVVDMGTEFGIRVEQDGTSDLHMFKGKAAFASDSASETKQILTLTAGQAKRIDTFGQVKDIPIKEQAFVRHFSSNSGFIWRGQKLSLADIVGNGNGLGTGRTNVYVYPLEGYKESLYCSEKGNEYHALAANQFVDGLFIPDGSKRQIISSEGHVFIDCPKTNGQCYAALGANLNQGVDYNGGGNLAIRVVDPSAQGTPAFILADETYTVTGTETGIELMPDDWSENRLGTGTWVHFELSTPVMLAENRQYGFDVTVTTDDWSYHFETAGVVEDSYAGGSAYSTGTKGGTNSLNLDELYRGDRTFIVELTEITPNFGYDAITPKNSPKVSYNAIAPEISPSDVYFLGESTIDNQNIGGFPEQTYSGDNDYATYIAADRRGLGQTFTTGSNPEGYTMKGFWLKNVSYTQNLYGGNGTWWYLGATNMKNSIIQFGGQKYGDQNHPCLLMHANMGITFDLSAIRVLCPDIKMTHFTSQFGIADFEENAGCNADFWVLIDGQVRQSRRNVTQKGVLYNVSIELGPSDRFLTLVTTDGGDDDYSGAYQRPYTSDWCVFVEPTLVLQTGDN